METTLDDAAGGARGLRASVTPELLASLRHAYGADVDGVKDLGGSSNLNIRVTINGAAYVARIYRPSVTEQRLTDLQHVRAVAAAGGVPTPVVRLANDGRPFIRLADRLVEVERFVDRDGDMDSWANLEAGLPTLGRIHSLLREEKVNRVEESYFFANYISSADAVEKTARGVERIRGWGPTGEERALAAMAEQLAELVSDGEHPLRDKLRIQLAHGSFWDNNVFFRDERLVLVTDFDFMSERPRIDDLALTLYFTNCAFRDGALDPMRRVELGRLVDAYESGLDQPLSEEERATLPFAIARQPLWSIGGWVVRLDDEGTARRHIAGMNQDFVWALAMARDATLWAEAFAGKRR